LPRDGSPVRDRDVTSSTSIDALQRRLAEAEAALREKADAEVALQESEALRRIALEGGRMGSWRWNLRDELIWGDAAFLALWGLPASVTLHPLSAFTERMSPQGQVEMGEMVTRAIDNGEAFDGLLEVTAGPTQGRWVRWRGVAERERPWIVNGVSFDVTEDRLLDARLRASEARQAFLLNLSDTLRLLSDASEIMATITAGLGQHLAVGQVAYAEAEASGETVTITRDWNDGTIPSNVGRHQLEAFGSAFIADLKQGQTIVIGDVEHDPRTTSAQARATFARASIAGFINVPLVKDGRLVAVLAIHSWVPRTWSPQEVVLTEEVAERTWASVERARAEGALRQSEGRLASDLAGMRQLHDVQGKISGSPDFVTALDEILAAAVSFTKTDRGTVQLVPASGEGLEIVRARGFEPGSPMIERFRTDSFDQGCEFVRVHRQQLVVADTLDLPGLAGTPDGDAIAASGVRAFQSTPMVSRNGEMIGVLSTHFRQPHRPSEDELRLLDLLAWSAANYISRHYADEALRESESRFRQFAEASSDVLWIRDAATREWEYLSPAFEAIYGLSVADALTGDTFRNWTDLIVEDDRAGAIACIERVREGGHATFEYRVRRPDGGLRWLRNTDFPMRGPNGTVERVGGVGQDVTELKKVEAALQESEGRLRTLMEGIPQLVWRSRDRGEWTWAGPQWLAFTGQSLEECRGLGWLEVVHPDDREASLLAWEEANPHGMLDTEFRVRRASDGAYLWHHTRSVPVRDPAGRILEWLGTTTDVDDLRRLQEAQAVMVTELQHRTRNLIAVVRSIAQQTMSQTGPGEAFREQFNARLGALSRVQGLLSRSDSEPITIGQLVRMELDALGARDGSRIALDGPEVPLRPSVVQTMALALHELATNARKYGALSTERGHLTVRWYVHVPEGEDRRLAVEWIEHDITHPEESSRSSHRGYGRELIERALPYALQARTRYELGETELRCSIDLPLTAQTRKASP